MFALFEEATYLEIVGITCGAFCLIWAIKEFINPSFLQHWTSRENFISLMSTGVFLMLIKAIFF